MAHKKRRQAGDTHGDDEDGGVVTSEDIERGLDLDWGVDAPLKDGEPINVVPFGSRED